MLAVHRPSNIFGYSSNITCSKYHQKVSPLLNDVKRFFSRTGLKSAVQGLFSCILGTVPTNYKASRTQLNRYNIIGCIIISLPFFQFAISRHDLKSCSLQYEVRPVLCSRPCVIHLVAVLLGRSRCRGTLCSATRMRNREQLCCIFIGQFSTSRASILLSYCDSSLRKQA